MIKLNDYLQPLFGRAEETLNIGLGDVEAERALKKAVSAIASIESLHQTVSERFESVVSPRARMTCYTYPS